VSDGHHLLGRHGGDEGRRAIQQPAPDFAVGGQSAFTKETTAFGEILWLIVQIVAQNMVKSGSLLHDVKDLAAQFHVDVLSRRAMRQFEQSLARTFDPCSGDGWATGGQENGQEVFPN
jgi:hypothetical protein